MAPTAAITGTQPPILPSTLSPTISATGTPAPAPAMTASPTAAVITNQTMSPTDFASGLPEVAVPTLAPTFSLGSVVQSLHLQFSTWTDSTLTLEEQEQSLVEILNVAMCSTGAQLITRNMTDACPPGVWQDAGEPTVIWNQPVAFATLLDTSYWRWNFTYSVLDVGYQTQDTLQENLDDSITSGQMDETLVVQWDAPSRAKVVGTERPIITGIPQHSADILRTIGVVLAVLTVLVVCLLTRLARQHRHRKDAKAVQIVFSSSTMEGDADVNLEEMLSQSREIALQQKPSGFPPGFLPAASSKNNNDSGSALQQKQSVPPALLPDVPSEGDNDDDDIGSALQHKTHIPPALLTAVSSEDDDDDDEFLDAIALGVTADGIDEYQILDQGS